MTVAARPTVVSYEEDGESSVFAVPFRFKAATDLIVERLAGGSVTTLTPGVAYTVTGGATDAGGSVTLAAGAGSTGTVLRIRRFTTRVQPMVYTPGDRFPAASHEDALDRGILISQEQDTQAEDTASRALLVPAGEVAPALDLANAEGQILGLVDGKITSIPISVAFSGGSPIIIASRVLLAALPIPPAGQPAELAELGYAGTFYFVIADLSVQVAADTQRQFYVAPASAPTGVSGAWVRQGSEGIAYAGQQTVRQKLDFVVLATDPRFAGGARGDGVHDDRPAIQAAIDYLNANGGGTVELPPSTCLMTVTPAADGAGVTCLTLKEGVGIKGQNRFASILKMADGQIGPGTYLRGISTYGQVSSVVLRDFTYDGNRTGQGPFAQQGNGGSIVVNGQRVHIEGVSALESNGQGIQVAAPVGQIVDKLMITHCIVDGTSGSTLNADGTVAAEYNGNGCGIQISQVQDWFIVESFVNNTKDNGIDIYNENGSNVPTGGNGVAGFNALRNVRCGLFPETSAHITILGNTVYGALEAGIAINRINGAPDMMIVRDNRLEYCFNGVRVSGNTLSLDIVDNFIGFITSAAGAGILLANSANVLVRNNTFNIAYDTVPLVAQIGPQAVQNRITGNWFFGNPQPGYLTYTQPGADTFETVVDDWNAVNNLYARTNGEGAFYRGYGTIDHFSATISATIGQVGFNGADARAKYALPADASDAATTQTLANALKAAMISFGLGA